LLAVLASLLALGLLVAAPAGAQDGTLEVDLVEIDGSGINGTAILTDGEDGVTVEIEVTGDAVVGGHPVHIHEGTCDNLDPAPAYPLADIDEDGLSETTVDVTLDELTASAFAINAHLSAEEIGVYVTCGNLTAAEAAPTTEEDTSGTGGTTTTTAPSTGVGSALGDDDNGLLLALVALAGVLAVAGVALRVRETRI
jgi:hypothetical protein